MEWRRSKAGTGAVARLFRVLCARARSVGLLFWYGVSRWRRRRRRLKTHNRRQSGPVEPVEPGPHQQQQKEDWIMRMRIALRCVELS